MSDQVSVTREECEAILKTPRHCLDCEYMDEPFEQRQRLARAHIALLDSHEQTVQREVARERERCARIAESFNGEGMHRMTITNSIAAAIRRGK